MTLRTLSPEAARQLIERGAVLVDIRSAAEHKREHIAQARHVPLEQLAQGAAQLDQAQAVIFHCSAGNRTQMNVHLLGSSTTCEAYVLEGGLEAWRRAGMPLVRDHSQALPLQRQVQIAAGALVLLGSVLGVTVSPWFHLLASLVGAGLVFAGLSGFCGLARLLLKAPWNRKDAAH